MRKIRLISNLSVWNKLFLKQLLPILAFLFFVNGLSAQAVGDFQSKATGNWSAVATWQTYDGTAWVDAAALPDLSQAIKISIQTGHTITVDIALIANNAALNILVNGYLKETAVITKTAAVWTINGTYEFNHPSASGSGLPTATWNDGSTCILTAIKDNTTGINGVQSFYNLTINSPTWNGSYNLGWSTGTITIRGNVTVQNTGSGRWNLCAPAAGAAVTVNIAGNLVVDGSASTSSQLVGVTSNGTSNGTTTVIVNVQGNVLVAGNPTNNAWTKFVSMQNHYNLLYREDEREMIPICKEQVVGLTPYSPLAAGRLSRPWSADTLRSKTDVVAVQKYDSTKESDMEIVKRVEALAEKRGYTMTQISLAWQFAKGVTAPLIGATKAKYFDDAMGSFGIVLSDEDISYLEDLYIPHKIVGAL